MKMTLGKSTARKQINRHQNRSMLAAVVITAAVTMLYIGYRLSPCDMTNIVDTLIITLNQI